MSVGPGWASIVEQLRQDLARLGVELGVTYEKYGTLHAETRGDWDTGDTHLSAQVDALLAAAEAASSCVCEDCGGSGREVRLASGWVKTLCASCRAKR